MICSSRRPQIASCTFSVIKYFRTMLCLKSANVALPRSSHLILNSKPWSVLTSPRYFATAQPLLHSSQRLYSTESVEDKKSTGTIPSNPKDVGQVTKVNPTSLITPNALVEQDSTKFLYDSIIEAFPGGIQMAFAYGSGAVQQQGTKSKDMKKNMLDFIFVVDRPYKWHRQNLEKHPHHYSFLKRLGPRNIARIQERYGAGVYFNTLVPMHGRTIKYGVISTAKLITDLLDWESLYIAGRLHKPINLLIMPTDENLITALRVNLKSATHAALLLLPDMFSEEQFYTKIASLSYAGDVRMSIAEDNNKVNNIVKPSLPLFRRMYSPFVLNQEHVTWWQEEGQIEQALTFHSRQYHLSRLPAQVLYGLLMKKYKVGVFPDLEEIIRMQAHDVDCGSRVAQSVQRIVSRSSTTQTVKAFFTAGVSKSLRYSSRKVLKKLKS